MTKGEKILSIVAVLAFILKILLVPGSGLLTVLSFTLLSILYFPLGFATLNGIPIYKIFQKKSYEGISTWRMIGTIGLGMSLSAIVIGLLFRLQSYPGAQMNLLIGVVLSFLIGIVALVRYMEKKSGFYKNAMIKIAVLCVLGVVMFMTPHSKLFRLTHSDDVMYPEEISH